MKKELFTRKFLKMDTILRAKNLVKRSLKALLVGLGFELGGGSVCTWTEDQIRQLLYYGAVKTLSK